MSTATKNHDLKPKVRFKEFTGQWDVKLLKEVSRILDGTHQTPLYVSKGIPFYSVEHITSDNFKETKYIAEEVYSREAKRVRIESGDILMTRIGDVGTAKYIDWDVKASFYVSLSLIKCNNDVEPRFLAHYINSPFFQHDLWKKTIHAAFPKKINLGDIGECKIRIPTKKEQSGIAAFLDQIDIYTRNLRAQKEELERYKKGMMQKVFSQEIRFKDENGNNYPNWEEATLGKIAYITTGSSNRIDSTLKGDYTFFDRSMDIRASSKFLFDTEAIIVAGEGQEFYPKHFIGKFDLHQRTYAIMNFKNCSGLFLFYYLTHKRRYFNKMAVGTTVPSLRLPIFNEMPLLLPTRREQEKLAQFFAAIDSILELNQQQITLAAEWKKGLMQKMFI